MLFQEWDKEKENLHPAKKQNTYSGGITKKLREMSGKSERMSISFI